MAPSIATGFIGGQVMPSLAVGGTAGLALHLIVPAFRPPGLLGDVVAVAGSALAARSR